MNSPDSAKDAPVFEQSLERLAEIVDQLEDGRLSLGESLAAYEEGIKHLKVCHEALGEAERKIEILSGFDAAGNPVTRAFDDTATAGEENVARRSRSTKSRPKAECPPAETVDGNRELF